MGNKTRTRRTKWRRLSLGDASGPEEEDDETQPQEQQEPEELRQNVVVLPSDEKEQSVCVEHDKKSKFASAVVVTTTVNNNNNNSTAAASSDGVANCASSGREEEQTKSAMMVSNHSNQRGPAWKLPASNSQPVKNGYYNVNNGYQSNSGRPTGGSSNAPSAANGFRRANNGPSARYNSFNGTYGNNGYGRANSWNNGSSNGYANADHHHHHGAPGLSKMHGIEKKIFNDEEYTKISTPRQEVLFKKGSIGAKKKLSTTTSAPPVGSSVHADSEQDSLNGNAASPVSPSQGDSADPFQYSGNDSGSNGDASSTAGESAAPCDAAMAAASGAALQTGYADGTPLVCFPMYDFYGGYGGMYPGSMLVQTYPGGPIVAAVPVPMPVQTIDWYGGAGGARAASNGDATNGGEVGYYYALGYPAGSEVAGSSQLPETSSSTRRNSLESYQASSQEVMSSETGSSSENSSPCQSTGPSSQGPASPQGELVSPAIDPKAQTGGGAATAAAAAAVVMDMTMMSNHQQLDNNLHHHRKMAVTGFVYPYAAYGLAPPALYASGGGSSEQLCDPNKQQLYYYYPDVFFPNAYEPYDVEQGGEEEFEALEEAMDVNADVVVTTSVEEEKLIESIELDGAKPDESGEQLEGSESNKKALEPKETREVAPPTAVANASAGTGRRKKRRKKRNKTQTTMADAVERTESLKLARPIQPLVRVTDDGAAEDEEEDEAATAEEETLVTAVKEENDAKKEEMTLPAASSISLVANDPATPTADSSSHDLLLVEEAVYPPHSSRVEPPTPLLSSPSHTEDSGQQPQSTPDLASSNAPSDDQLAPDTISNTTDDAIFPPLAARHQEPSGREDCPSFEADPAETLDSPAFCSTPSFPLFSTPLASTIASEVVLPEEKEESSPKDTDAAVLFAVQLLSQLLPASSDSGRIQSTPSSRTDSFERDSLMGVSDKVEEPIDRDSLDGEEPQASLCDDFVYLQMDDDDDKNEVADVYFEDDEPQAIVLCDDDPPPALTLCLEQPQLWRTVILEESEPNSKETSPLLCSDSGIGAGTPSQSPTPNAVETPNEEEAPAVGGPITKAVSRWLESAPIEQQLIASSNSVMFMDNEGDSEDDDIYYHHQEVEEEEEVEALNKVTVPKNGVATLRTAPSSDGPAMRRVGSDSAVASDASDDLLQEAGAQLLTRTCDPAKFSVYYQLGVSVDQDDSGADSVVQHSDSIKSTTLDDSFRQCSRSNSSSSLLTTGSSLKSRKKKTSAQSEDGGAKKKKKKRANSWRRILLLHRAAHNKSRSGDDAASISSTSNDRRLKSVSQSCCALQ